MKSKCKRSAFFHLCLVLVSAVIGGVRGVSALPEADQFFIDQTSVEKYGEYVLPEALELVRSGEWVLEVQSDGTHTFSVDEGGASVPVLKDLLVKSNEWWSAHRRVVLPFQGETLEGYATKFSFSGRIQRVVPSLISKTLSTQILRELVTVSYGKGIPLKKWLTFRFVGDGPDAHWIVSPVLAKARRVPAENRTDLLYGTHLSLEDLFTISEKSETLTELSSERRKYLVPFVKIGRKQDLTTRIDCQEQLSEHEPLAEKESKASPANLLGSGWMPPGIAFQPRSLIRVEVRSGNPYSYYHRQVLYFDTVNGTVPYKVAYNQSGVAKKLVMTIFQSTPDGVLPISTIAKQLDSQQATRLLFNNISLCDELEGKDALKPYSPNALVTKN